MAHADGVLPDEISRDPRSESWLVFVDFADGADVKGWLENTATPAVQRLTCDQGELGRLATCTTGFGGSLFDKVNLANLKPSAVTSSLPASIPTESHDLVFYVFALSDALVADFLRSIDTPGVVKGVTLERGYQRGNHREVFGQLDGLRNIPAVDRPGVAFVSDDDPEPDWARGGASMAYLKIQQHVDAWGNLSAEDQAAVIGRRPDGTRLDLPAGTDPTSEGQFTEPNTPSPCAHVRKAGPRGGPTQDGVRIFRRGTPFIEADNGVLAEGLQFVSYQASVDDFLTILQRWMLNAGFPTSDAGVDSLLDPAKGLTSILKGGLYFAVPHDPRFIGAGLFDSADHGTIAVRLVVTTDGASDPNASLEGAIITVANNGAVIATATTDAAGHATFHHLPEGVVLTVTETSPPARAQIPDGQGAQTVTLHHCGTIVVTFTNTRPTGGGGYSG